MPTNATAPTRPRLDDPVTAALRALAADAVEHAKSGHPGAPLGLAEVAAVLWRRWLRHNPADPSWIDRDRFVLSNGHASMLLYAVLHLSGYDLPVAELRRFRQLHSRTPGHPEFGVTPGVETTTGPLGQGFANAVGMAIAEKTLAAQFNRPGHVVVDHRTFVVVGDGCLMEGVSHEAASLAGRLGLGKLIALYDDNGISIDGRVDEWFADDTAKRFEAYGWHVVRDVDGHDPAAVDAALAAAVTETERPSLLCCRTVIGRGAPTKQGHHDTHGAPLGAREIEGLRAALAWPHAPFEIPETVAGAWDARERGAALQAEWQRRLARYRAAHPDLAEAFARRMRAALPDSFPAAAREMIAAAADKGESLATRKANQDALSELARLLPELLGGSADLAHSNLTMHPLSRPITRDPAGNTIFFGVREFAMVAIANGLALHGGFIPFVATFLVFSDYARNAIRMGALMRQRVVHVLTHDSIGLGEDGPTHQPIEHVESLRLIPNLDVWRPCDAVETAVAWTAAVTRGDGPAALVLSRQALPHQPRTAAAIASIERGGYVLIEPERAPAAILIATGSEVHLARAAAALLAADGVAVRVVSMPCVEVFERQDAGWRATVLPPHLPVVVVEAGATRGWGHYAGCGGHVIGIDRFGESAPGAALFAHFGFTPEHIAEAVRATIARPRASAIR
ncbi:MAG: transketolase [Bradyrhizobiaceae bacterium]|nr:MAG: transketolase [Bradyrhizobiaceae bacterium]